MQGFVTVAYEFSNNHQVPFSSTLPAGLSDQLRLRSSAEDNASNLTLSLWAGSPFPACSCPIIAVRK